MDDARWMRSALTLARRTLGTTWPNPAVGCILVNAGRVVGRGVTAPGGRPHAERRALAMAGEAARGATAYVTLEPCAHHGRTPPCTDALIAAGIVRVVCPMEDPDPRVSGRGFAALRDAGIAVDVGLLHTDAAAVNAGFLSRILRGRPHVLLKSAASLDGRIATRTGESRWITGPAARRRVHLMRATADAVLIGVGTARVDDPMLNVRGLGPGCPQPVRVVADSRLSLSQDSQLVRTAHDQALWVLHGTGADPARRAALEAAGVLPLAVAEHHGQLDITAAMGVLGAQGLTRVLCEGGGSLAASMLRAGLVDRIALFSAGAIIGGDGTAVVQGFGLDALGSAPRFELVSTTRIGGDTLSDWRAGPAVR